MIRFLLFVAAFVLFLLAALISAGVFSGVTPLTLAYFGLACLALALTPAPPVQVER